MVEITEKRVLVVDDNGVLRAKAIRSLERVGHKVVAEAASGKEALDIICTRTDLDLEVAALDSSMPNSGDGKKVAEALIARFPKILIASISGYWEGTWKDPHYNKNKIHPAHVNDLDTNGRGPVTGPALYLEQMEYNYDALALAIGEWRFNLVDSLGLATIKENQDLWRRLIK